MIKCKLQILLLSGCALLAPYSALSQEDGHKAFEIENIVKQGMIRDVTATGSVPKMVEKVINRDASAQAELERESEAIDEAQVDEERFKRLDRLVYAHDLAPFFEFERAATALAEVAEVNEPIPEIHCNADNVDTCDPNYEFELEFVPPKLQKPIQAVRALQVLQDDLVQGKEQAFEKYRAALEDTYIKLSKLRTENWQYKKNLDAIALFTLIGGNPELGQQVLSQTSLSANHSLYLEGAIAYSKRDFDNAYIHFSKINFKHVPPSIAAQFAVVKSMLSARFNVKKAREFLNIARRLAPGTLSEEAALRRLVRMASDDDDMASFVRSSKVYVSQFKDSFYFTDFIKNYAYSLVRMDRKYEAQMLESLKEITAQLEKNEQLAIVSYVAQSSINRGLLELVGWASQHGKGLAKINGRLYVQMSLYHLASIIADSSREEEVMILMQKINPRILNDEDKEFFTLVKALYERLYNSSMTEEDIIVAFNRQEQAFPGDNAAKKILDEGAEFAEENQMVIRAKNLIEKSEEVLKGNAS